MSQTPIITIGTRGSPLALAQAREVRARLAGAHRELANEGAIAIEVIKTSGDRFLDRPLADIGGKGLFTKEIEEALLREAIDIAVHSMKDVPTFLPKGLEISCVLEREDPRDAFFSSSATGLDDLGPGAVVGTAALRRQAQIRARRPDLEIVVFRGNVQSRLKKLAAGEVDATLLALAGLKRLGLEDKASAILPVEEMLPAVAQGAIGIECRSGDSRAKDYLSPLNHDETALCIGAERALLAVLDGSCRTPIAALCECEGERVRLRSLIARPDGSEILRTTREGSRADAVALGEDAGRELLKAAGPDFFILEDMSGGEA